MLKVNICHICKGSVPIGTLLSGNTSKMILFGGLKFIHTITHPNVHVICVACILGHYTYKYFANCPLLSPGDRKVFTCYLVQIGVLHLNFR